MLLITSPDSPNTILPKGINSPSGSCSPLDTQFPNTQPGVSPSVPGAAQGQGGTALLGRLVCL